MGVPLEFVSQEAWTAGTQGTQERGRFAGQRISAYLTCGGTAGVSELADSYLVTIGVLATLRPTAGGTQLQMQVGGSAKDPFTSVAARQCVSTGRLEARVDSTLRALLRSR